MIRILLFILTLYFQVIKIAMLTNVFSSSDLKIIDLNDDFLIYVIDIVMIIDIILDS